MDPEREYAANYGAKKNSSFVWFLSLLARAIHTPGRPALVPPTSRLDRLLVAPAQFLR